jgi:hypothetical protein
MQPGSQDIAQIAVVVHVRERLHFVLANRIRVGLLSGSQSVKCIFFRAQARLRLGVIVSKSLQVERTSFSAEPIFSGIF